MKPASRRLISLGLGGGLIIAVLIFRDPLRHWVGQRAALANPAPPLEVIEEMIETAPDRTAAILAAWHTGRIVQREVAASEIGRNASINEPLPMELESVVLAGALDPDMNVRETCLGILRKQQHPALTSLAAAQLSDPDPQTRLLGLEYLKQADAKTGVPALIPILNDPNPLIVATGLRLLEKFSGEKFGVKIEDTLPTENPQTGLKEFSETGREKARAGATQARIWWSAHQADFPTNRLEIPREAFAARQPLPASEFSLRSLDGREVRLTDLRGKVVLINFWTTWCTACIGEIPGLVALQKEHVDNLVILGVSLDFVPDEHGDLLSLPAVEEQGHAAPENQTGPIKPEDAEKIRAKVIRTVKARGINYPVLLDEKNEVGGRFNGGELPTTVIIDPQGNVRRRFIGERDVSVFEAMIAEAGKPASSDSSTNAASATRQ